ncbi:hypothetical protein MHPYR_110014 [uncultured Mycobacterium sp.]|uniref:Uncharacterized protein n=1 Tax=uncultured Mycobacterium sp. TaxID=171292 RepID=A0A1Y5NY72_9MYCO|nr:hypothetical protein MHPYR_110014 [uncultured Mycobacterium sp.]
MDDPRPSRQEISDAITGLAHTISAALTARGLALAPGSVQALEIAIDALDIAGVRPFWTAATGYVDEPGPSDLSDGLIDPSGRGGRDAAVRFGGAGLLGVGRRGGQRGLHLYLAGARLRARGPSALRATAHR